MICYNFKLAGLVYILLLLILKDTYSQDKLNMGFHISPTESSIIPNIPATLTGYTSNKSDVIDLGFDVRYFLGNIIGIESGLNLLTYKSVYKATSSSDNFETVDSENDSYLREVSGSNISETDIIRSIEIPVHLLIRSWISNKLILKLSAGPGIFIPLQKQCQESAIFSYSGYYSKYGGAILTNIPEYGFNQNVNVNGKNNIPCRPINLDIGCSLGANYCIDDDYELFASVNYNTSLSKPVTQVNNYHISNELGSYYSILSNGNNKFTNISFSVGIQINIIWFSKY